jgi:hypothetical protein
MEYRLSCSEAKIIGDLVVASSHFWIPDGAQGIQRIPVKLSPVPFFVVTHGSAPAIIKDSDEGLSLGTD